MKVSKFRKGHFYAAYFKGNPSLGIYLGQIPGYHVFRGSDFAIDQNQLSGGVPNSWLDLATVFELPFEDCAVITQDKVFDMLEKVLPE